WSCHATCPAAAPVTQSPSQHGALGRDFDGGDSTSVQHNEPTGMLAPKSPTLGGEGADNVVNRPCFVNRVFVFESDIHMAAADQAYPKHHGCHGDPPRVR